MQYEVCKLVTTATIIFLCNRNITDLLTASVTSLVSMDFTVATSKLGELLKPSPDIVDTSDSSDMFELPFMLPKKSNKHESNTKKIHEGFTQKY